MAICPKCGSSKSMVFEACPSCTHKTSFLGTLVFNVIVYGLAGVILFVIGAALFG